MGPRTPPIILPRRRITKPAASFLHSRHVGCALKNHALHGMGKTNTSTLYRTCGTQKNFSRVIYESPKDSEKRDSFGDQLRVAGAPPIQVRRGLPLSPGFVHTASFGVWSTAVLFVCHQSLPILLRFCLTLCFSSPSLDPSPLRASFPFLTAATLFLYLRLPTPVHCFIFFTYVFYFTTHAPTTHLQK